MNNIWNESGQDREVARCVSKEHLDARITASESGDGAMKSSALSMVAGFGSLLRGSAKNSAVLSKLGVFGLAAGAIGIGVAAWRATKNHAEVDSGFDLDAAKERCLSKIASRQEDVAVRQPAPQPK